MVGGGDGVPEAFLPQENDPPDVRGVYSAEPMNSGLNVGLKNAVKPFLATNDLETPSIYKPTKNSLYCLYFNMTTQFPS